MSGPYIEKKPGDLILAEDWNAIQEKIREDIEEQIAKRLEDLDSVPNAENADKLDSKTREQLASEIVEQALQEIPGQTGYKTYYKRLNKVGQEEVIEHGLHNFPLVDLYQLDYFEVVCDEDEVREKRNVIFYLHHSKERTITFKPEAGPSEKVKIDREEGEPFRIAFAEMLQRYKVPYTEDSSLGDLETEFWKAFDPNDEFDDIQYCHSPWFTGCCREEKSVKALKKSGDWDDFWFQMRPRKTDNLYDEDPAPDAPPVPGPSNVQITQIDFDRAGISLLQKPVVDPEMHGDVLESGPSEFQERLQEELNLLVILKV